MNDQERRELKDALVKVVAKLVLMALVVFGAVDYTMLAKYLRALEYQVQVVPTLACGVPQ